MLYPPPACLLLHCSTAMVSSLAQTNERTNKRWKLINPLTENIAMAFNLRGSASFRGIFSHQDDRPAVVHYDQCQGEV